MQQGVRADIAAKLLELFRGGQLAVDQQVGRFGEFAALGNHFHRITTVAKMPFSPSTRVMALRVEPVLE